MAQHVSPRDLATMSRAERTSRGAAGAAVATVLAGASHALAGGHVAPLGLAVTALIALPLCVALAGRAESLWRLGFAVTASQFLYHWSFSGVGASAAGAVAGHQHHSTTALAFTPQAALAADASMWAAHAIAAALTILLLARGEVAARRLREALVQWLPFALQAPTRIPVRSTVLRLTWATPVPNLDLAHLSPTTRRGPPALLAPAL